jgi:hypothetical protein
MFRTAVPVLLALLTAMPAAAQAPPRAPKNAPVAITRPAASDDASFIAFPRDSRRQSQGPDLRRACASRAGAGLFLGPRLRSGLRSALKPAVDNLAAAIALEQGNGASWDTLATFAAEATVEPLDSRPGIVCAPTRPGYDGVAFSRLLDTTSTTGIDWAYRARLKRRCRPRRGRMPPKPAHSARISCA